MPVAYIEEEGIASWATSVATLDDADFVTISVVASASQLLVRLLGPCLEMLSTHVIRWRTVGDPVESSARRLIIRREMERVIPSFGRATIFETGDGLISSCAETLLPLSEHHLAALSDSRRTLLLVLREGVTCFDICVALQRHAHVENSTIRACLEEPGVLAVWQLFDTEPSIHAMQIFSSQMTAQRMATRLASTGAGRLPSVEELPNFIGLS